MINKDGNTAFILGIPLFSSSRDVLLKRLEKVLSAKRRLSSKAILIFTPNPEMMVYAQRHPDFGRLLALNNYNIPDGAGLVIASRLLAALGRTEVGLGVQRIAGTDLMSDLLGLASEHGWRVFFLGGQADTAGNAAKMAAVRFPRLQIKAGSGPLRVEAAEADENRHWVSQINDFKTDILFVGFGHGKQEKWLKMYQDELKVKLAMGIGGAFDFLSGNVQRAPLIWRRLGLEWLYRLLRQPWRLRRILDAVIVFPWLVLKQELSIRNS